MGGREGGRGRCSRRGGRKKVLEVKKGRGLVF